MVRWFSDSEFVVRSGNQMFQYYDVGNVQCWSKMSLTDT